MRSKNLRKGMLGILLAISMVVTGISPIGSLAISANAESVSITSMAYDDGPTFTASGTTQASFGFRMPVFNGGANTWSEVSSDLSVNVKVNGQWVDIDSVDSFVYNSNWGHWSDSGFNGYWFTVTETTYLQLYSKSNPSVTLDYNLIFNKADTSAVTSLTSNGNTTISANRTGTGFIAFPYAVAGGTSYSTDADSLVVYVKGVNEPDSSYVNIDNNAASGWIYDTNFGVESSGYWFTVSSMGSSNVKVCLKANENINLVYTITYSETSRSDYTVYANGSTTITADSSTGACGVVLPYLGGTGDDNLPTSNELGNFIYQYYDSESGSWVNFTDSASSGWFYQGNGYVSYSSKNQWGYFNDYVYGLWFQPVTEDFKLRIGYPTTGVAGDSMGNNYIEYTFVGAPDAYRPEDANVSDITVGGYGSSADLEGWEIYYDEEFDENTLNLNDWSYNTGYFLDESDPSTKGWGNNEAEYYTSDSDNVFLKDGQLHLVAKYDPYTFTCSDANSTQVTADYSSGKIISKDKVQFTYGRIDFCAKLPSGTGLWPALWMLPNDDIYGTWASSGEIDVMEARGRVTNATSGTIHYGGTWPNNTYTGTDYIFPDGSTFDDGYHVYSLIWEEDNLTWYVDGKFFQYIPKSQWYSAGSPTDTAPFDQDFYIILNLAVGGWFDGGVLPDSSFTSAEMLVDYVRVYKAEGTEFTPRPSTKTDDSTITTDEPDTKTEDTDTKQEETNPGTTDTPSQEEETVTETPFVPTDESGVHINSDGTATFYVKAENTSFAPMVYYGTNLTNPQLWMMGGYGMTANSSYGANYYSFTTSQTFSDSDSISYILSYTPVGTWGRIDAPCVTTTVSEAKAAVVTKEETKEETPVTEDTSKEEETPAEEEKEEVVVTPTVEEKTYTYGDYEIKFNADGTATLSIYANVNEMTPLCFWGVNMTDPQLWKMSGAVMELVDASTGKYSFTINSNITSGSTVSFMFGYTPVNEQGRRDTAITTVTK